MLRTAPIALSPAGSAWLALLDVAGSAQQLPDAAQAWNLARSAVPPRRAARRRSRVAVPAGRLLEVMPGPRRGAPLLEPANGALPGIDEKRERLSVFRVQAGGSIDGRIIEQDALVILARRKAMRGEMVAVADRRSCRLAVAGAAGLGGLPEEGRVLGVVEAVVGASRRRACA